MLSICETDFRLAMVPVMFGTLFCCLNSKVIVNFGMSDHSFFFEENEFQYGLQSELKFHLVLNGSAGSNDQKHPDQTCRTLQIAKTFRVSSPFFPSEEEWMLTNLYIYPLGKKYCFISAKQFSTKL
jgi:hypothetical protein